MDEDYKVVELAPRGMISWWGKIDILGRRHVFAAEYSDWDAMKKRNGKELSITWHHHHPLIADSAYRKAEGFIMEAVVAWQQEHES